MIVILGASHAGVTAAFELRRRGFDGRVVLVSDEAVLPYGRPQLSKEVLRGKPRELIRPGEAYEQERVETLLGQRAERVDEGTVTLANGERLPFDKLLIATGVRPRRIPIMERPNVSSLRTFEDAALLRARLDAGGRFVIVGGGVIGLEAASEMSARGAHVSLIERAPRLMERSLDPELSEYVAGVHRRRGVDVRLGVSVTSFDRDVNLSDGSTLTADHVLVGVGVEPNIEAVAHLGITDVHGVQTDNAGRTALSNIFATGDVASQPGVGRVETWANAQDHAIVVARAMLGENVRYEDAPWFWSDQGDLKIQVLGSLSPPRADRTVRGSVEGGRFSVFYTNDEGRVLGCAAINVPRDMAIARKWMRENARVTPARLGERDLASAKLQNEEIRDD